MSPRRRRGDRRAAALAGRALRCATGLFVVASLAASCGAQTRDVELTFYDDDSGPHGFTCHLDDDKTAFLANRVLADKQLSLVVDFIQLDGSPTCSGIALIEWCRSPPHSCLLLDSHRACLDVPVGALVDATGSKIDRLRAALAQVKGRLVAASAPDGIVLVRVVATTASCADVTQHGAGFDCARLVGCTTSCPVVLADAGGVVQLDLDVAPELCTESIVDICAAPNLADYQHSCGAQ